MKTTESSLTTITTPSCEYTKLPFVKVLRIEVEGGLLVVPLKSSLKEATLSLELSRTLAKPTSAVQANKSSVPIRPALFRVRDACLVLTST